MPVTLACALVLVLSMASDAGASIWRGAAGPIQVGLRIDGDRVRGEAAMYGCSVPPFVAENLPPTRVRDGRIQARRMQRSRRGISGISVKLHRSGGNYVGDVVLAGEGCRRRRTVVLHRSVTPVATGYWRGATDQQATVRFWVDPFGLFLMRAGPSGDVVSPTVIATCPASGERKTIRPYAVHVLLTPDGTFAVPGDPETTGTFEGHFNGMTATGTTRYAPEGCDSGLVGWSAHVEPTRT